MDEDLFEVVSTAVVSSIEKLDIPKDFKVNLMVNLTHFLSDYDNNVNYLIEKTNSKSK